MHRGQRVDGRLHRRRGVVIALVALAIAWWYFTDQRVGAANVAPVAIRPRQDAAATVSPPRAHPMRRATADVDRGNDPVSLQRARCMDDRRRQFQARRERLQDPATPDAAIEHALLTTLLSLSTPDADAGADNDEYRSARERWPHNAELAWFSAQRCFDGARCDPDTEWRHFASLEPNNAAVWLMAMNQARQDGDEARYEQALQRAAAARYYDPRIGTTFRHARALLLALPVPESCQSPAQIDSMWAQLGRRPVATDWADIEALGLDMAVAIPALGGLMGCKPSPHLATARRQDCIAVLSWVASGDSLLEQTIALGMLIQLTGNGPGSAQLRERYRRVAWLTRLMRGNPPIPEGFIVRMHTEGEVAVLQALAIAQGRWPPPADWLPDDARSRALIRTGRLPAQAAR